MCGHHPGRRSGVLTPGSWLALLLLSIAFGTLPVGAQSLGPISESALREAIKNGSSDSLVALGIKNRNIDFIVNEEIVAFVRRRGYTETVRALKDKAYALIIETSEPRASVVVRDAEGGVIAQGETNERNLFFCKKSATRVQITVEKPGFKPTSKTYAIESKQPIGYLIKTDPLEEELEPVRVELALARGSQVAVEIRDPDCRKVVGENNVYECRPRNDPYPVTIIDCDLCEEGASGPMITVSKSLDGAPQKERITLPFNEEKLKQRLELVWIGLVEGREQDPPVREAWESLARVAPEDTKTLALGATLAFLSKSPRFKESARHALACINEKKEEAELLVPVLRLAEPACQDGQLPKHRVGWLKLSDTAIFFDEEPLKTEGKENGLALSSLGKSNTLQFGDSPKDDFVLVLGGRPPKFVLADRNSACRTVTKGRIFRGAVEFKGDAVRPAAREEDEEPFATRFRALVEVIRMAVDGKLGPCGPAP